jgi:hypothetical protein
VAARRLSAAAEAWDWMREIRDDRQLSPTAKLCAFTLATYFDRRGECFPSRAVIGRGMGLSTRTVTRALAELREAGAVEITRRADNSSVYRRTWHADEIPF